MMKDGKFKEITFTGKIDEVLNQADKQYDRVKSENPDVVKGLTKDAYLDMIFKAGLRQISANMPKDPERDANDRAAKQLDGVENMPYTNNKLSIKLK